MKKAAFNINFLLLSIGLPLMMIIKTLVEKRSEFPPLFSMRRTIIMSKTLGFGLLVAILVVVISWFIAYLLFLIVKKPMLIYIALMILTLIPSFLYAYLWMNAFQMIFQRFALSGMMISVVVQVNYFIFLATLLWYHVFLLISEEYFDTAYMNMKMKKGHMIVLFEMSKIPFTFLLQLFLLLGIADYTIPSIFAYNTYPIEIMSLFASSMSLAPPIVASLPMIIVTILLVSFMTHHKDLSLISSIDSREVEKPWTNLWLKLLSWLLILVLMIPFILMIIAGLKSPNILETAMSYGDDYAYTLFTAVSAAIIIVVFSYFLNFYCFINLKKKKLVSIVMVILFGIPGTVIGLLVNSFYHEITSLIPGLYWLNQSVIPIIHVDFLRFLPIGFLVLSIGFKLIPRSYIEQGIMESKNHIQLVRHGVVESLMPYFLLSGFISFVFSVSELSGAIMVLPPGKSTITVTIYNYLHYGSTDVVAALSLVFIAIIIVSGIVFYLLIYKKTVFKKILVYIFVISHIFGLTSCTSQENNKKFESIDRQLDILVMEIYEDELYLGTTQGLYVLNQEFELQPIELNYPIGFIHALYASENHGLFIGGMNGLIIMKDEKQDFYDEDNLLPDKRVYTIKQNKDQHIFVGTFNGLVELDDQLNVVNQKIELLSSMVNVMGFDAMNNSIIASYNVRGGGLTIVRNNISTFYGEDSKLSSINATSLIVEDESFFIGGGMYETGGLDKFEYMKDEYRLVASFTEKDGLAGPKVRSLLLKDNFLFVGSEYDGLAILELNESMDEIVSYVRYTTKDGLTHNEIKCMIEYKDFIFLGTKSGLSKFEQ